jgi:predicted small secreted protein
MLQMARKFVIALVASGIVFAAAACNTVKGAGRDVSSVGQAGEEAIK